MQDSKILRLIPGTLPRHDLRPAIIETTRCLQQLCTLIACTADLTGTEPYIQQLDGVMQEFQEVQELGRVGERPHLRLV